MKAHHIELFLKGTTTSVGVILSHQIPQIGTILTIKNDSWLVEGCRWNIAQTGDVDRETPDLVVVSLEVVGA